MTLDVTIRQKLVRVLSSAAVCGLSISFIVGEAVDYKAAEISLWRADPRLLPFEYSPLRPVLASAKRISGERLQESFIAINSTGQGPAPGSVPTFQDSLRTILASPKKRSPANAAQAKAPRKGLRPVAKMDSGELRPGDEVIEAGEVERILGSIHDATAKLSGSKPAKTATISSGSIVVKALPDSGRDASSAVVQEVVLPVRRNAAREFPKRDEVINGAAVENVWAIRGRITGPVKSAKGHYEVGLFSKIDQNGIPVGFPLVQQILPAGVRDFQIKVPSGVDKGFLYGEFVAAATGARSWIAPPVNPWQRSANQFAELIHKTEDRVSSVSAAASLEEDGQWKVRGNVYTLFAREPIPQGDVVVKVRGRKESARTDKSGAFLLELPKISGTVYLEFLKAGYHPTLVAVPSGGNQLVRVDLASRTAIDQIAQRLGTRQISSKAVFIGKAVGAEGQPLKGVSLQMSRKAEGPFYFTEDGFPSTAQKSTTADGRFLFLNVDPGTGYVESFVNGEAIAPFLLSTVEGGEMVVKNLQPVAGTIKGRLFNPVSVKGRLMPVSGARVRVEGAADFTNTDSYGAFAVGPIKWMKGERLSLEFSAERFNNHRYVMSPDDKKDGVNLFAFPAHYVGRLARSMDLELDPSAGIVMGKVTGLSVRIDALADHSVVNSARDYYFDARGKLRGSHNLTDPRFGTYIIFNVPKGRTLLQGNDAQGVLRYSESVISSPASISILMD